MLNIFTSTEIKDLKVTHISKSCVRLEATDGSYVFMSHDDFNEAMHRNCFFVVETKNYVAPNGQIAVIPFMNRVDLKKPVVITKRDE